MSFSYNFNTGKVSAFYDPEYLKKAFGFSYDSDDLGEGSEAGAASVNNGIFENISMLSTEYQAKFGKTLNISDNYKLFDNGTITTLMSNSNWYNTTDEITYLSNTAKSRTDVYKEMFLEAFKTGYSSSLEFASTPVASATKANSYYNDQSAANQGYTFGATNLTLSSANLDTKEKLNALYDQLESEAAILKDGLNASELAYGGYPEIGYSSTEAEIALLNKQLDAATQNFVKVYDDLFGYYKIKAGAHANDNQTNNGDEFTREKEAATAATMAATLAMNYAQKYYSQTIKPTAADYVFGQAPLVFTDHSSKAYMSRLTVDGIAVQDAGYENYNGYDVDGNLISAGDYTYTKADGTLLTSASTPVSDYYYDGVWGHAAPPATVVCSTQDAQNTMLKDSLAEYSTANFDNILYKNQSGYVVSNKVYANNSTPTAYMWDMNNTAAIAAEKGKDKGSELSSDDAVANNLLKELGGTIPTYIQWMVRDSFGVGGLTPDIKNTTYCADEATFLTKDLFAAAQKLVDLKMKIQVKSIESSINNQMRAEYEARVGAKAAILETLAKCTGTDPYTVNIDGQNYILGQDKNDDGTISNITEILGINDTQENLFKSLKELDENNDGYVSQEEMKARNIILNAVDNESGQLTNAGYDMGLVKGISLADLQAADGTNNIFGRFTMDLQNKKVNGDLTFEDKSYFDKLFGSNVDFAVLSQSVATPSPIVAKSVPVVAPVAKLEETEAAVVQPVESAQTEPKTYSLFDAKNFSFDFVGAEDNKSVFETLLDQLSWQMNINNLTSTQRYNIIDGLDANEDVTLAKSEIQQQLEKINLSA